ncbi:thiazole synthase ThiGH ThiG subunit [Bradyrhizobium yuanmingense]
MLDVWYPSKLMLGTGRSATPHVSNLSARHPEIVRRALVALRRGAHHLSVSENLT